MKPEKTKSISSFGTISNLVRRKQREIALTERDKRVGKVGKRSINRTYFPKDGVKQG